MRSALQSAMLGRRIVLAGTASLYAVRGAKAQPGGAHRDPSSLLVAGPSGSLVDHWADILAVALGRQLPGRGPLARKNVGGLDGVTGANRFEASGEPDGSTAMLVPGAAALSWLVGETRARFDPAHWVPLLAGTSRAVLVSRVALQPGRHIRIASLGPVGPELPAFLALSLIGIEASPSPNASADAMMVQGAGVAAALSAAGNAGMAPVMVMGGMGADVELTRDPMFPTVPTALELVGGRAQMAMLGALRASILAIQLDAGLVLPQLTPAASVALWRSACAPLLQDPDVLAQAARLETQLVSATKAAACTNAIAGDPAPLLALRHWLATRYDWRPT